MWYKVFKVYYCSNGGIEGDKGNIKERASQVGNSMIIIHLKVIRKIWTCLDYMDTDDLLENKNQSRTAMFITDLNIHINSVPSPTKTFFYVKLTRLLSFCINKSLIYSNHKLTVAFTRCFSIKLTVTVKWVTEKDRRSLIRPFVVTQCVEVLR